MFTLFKKEINGFLNSLIGYIVIVVFLLVIGLFLWMLPVQFNILDFGYASMDGLFMLAPYVFLFLIPAITMRSFADEKKSGTLELLMTQPLTDLHVILAKYFAGVVLVLFSLLPTLVYFFSVYHLGLPPGNMDVGGMWGSYIGLFFLGTAFVAIGIFASSLTDNQVISFVIAVFLSAFFYMGFEFIYTFILSGKVGLVVQSMGLNDHFSSMSRGVVDTRDLIYFISVSLFFILCTKLVLERRKKRSNLFQLSLGLFAIILVNIIASFVFTRFDLTVEKRYSLSPATKKLVRNLNDVVFFKVYLDGDLPAGFRRLSNETKEMLDEFRAYNKNIQYEFTDPSENPNAKERNDNYRLLVEQGLQPTDLRISEKGQSSQLIIFPGAMVSYKGHEVPVQLLMTQIGQDSYKVLNNSIQSLEYNLASAIQKLAQSNKPRIAFIDGQGELSQLETIDIFDGLSEFYNVDHVTIANKISSLTIRLKTDSTHDQLVNKYRAIIIAKPVSPFDEKDKFLIDQFIMRGGSVLWLIDPVFASMDSLEKFGTTMGIPQDLNLEDMLFAYGVRPNTNLVLDLQALPIPVRSGQIGNQPQIQFFPWYFFPVLTPVVHHPMVIGLNAIKTEFVSSLDTVEGINVKKTVLLTTSPYSRVVNAPALIDLEILKSAPDERMYASGPQPVAVLLEGNFTSIFQFRLPPEISGNKDLGFLSKSVKPAKMIVMTDGDIIKNQIDISKGYFLPLGYDQFTKKTFGNKDLILNAMNYLCDNSGLITIRSRELKLRSLDMTRVEKQKLFWQVFNTLLPILLVLIFGFIKYRLRIRKYARPIVK